jgi:hypothetical protein
MANGIQYHWITIPGLRLAAESYCDSKILGSWTTSSNDTESEHIEHFCFAHDEREKNRVMVHIGPAQARSELVFGLRLEPF